MSVVGTAAAAATLWFTGGNVQAAMAAYSIGSGVEAYATAPDIEGPRLEDLAVQMSSYGAPIPYEWGVNRHAGTIIWPQVLEAKESKHEESAKGGPDNVSYTYSQSFAVLIAATKIKGLQQIWANKKLVYDASPENTGPVKDPSLGTFRLYLGTEDQEVDPLIEATDGPSPAYLGLAYIVFEDYDVTDTQGRPPQMEFRVITEGEDAPDEPPVKFGDFAVNGNVGASVIDPDRGTLWVVNGNRNSTTADTGGDLDGPTLNVYDLETKELLATISNGTDSGSNAYGPTNRREYGDLAYGGGIVYTATPLIELIAGNAAYGFSAETMSEVFAVPFSAHPPDMYWPTQSGTVAIASDGTLVAAGAGSFSGSVGVWNPDAGLLAVSDIDGMGATTQAVPLEDHRVALIGPNGLFIIQPSIPIIESARVLTAQFGGVPPKHVAYDPKNKRLLVTAGGLWVVDVADPAGTIDYVTEAYAASGVSSSIYDPIANLYYVAGGNANVVAINPGSFSVERTVPLSPMSEAPVEMHFSEKTGELILVGSTTVWALKVDDVLTPAKIPLSKIVSDICTMDDGLSPADIDVSQLTPLVDGYILSRQMTRRAAIEGLMPIYHFDAVENGPVLQFVMRGGAVAETIEMEDRAARDFGGDLPDSLSIVRAQDLELPYEVELEYPDVDADHLVGAQYSRRITKDTKQKVNMQTAVVMSAELGKKVTAVNLYEAWLQGSFKWTTTRKYSHLLPTDVVELPTKEATYRGRITSKREQPNGIIEWEAKQEAVDVYTQSGAGAAPTNYVKQSIFTPGKTVLELMDIPLVRDQDAGKGVPVAMAGTSASWPGAQLFKSSDNGSTYGALYSQTGAAVIGTATTKLGDFTAGDVFDGGNSVTVKIQAGGQLISYSEAQLLDGTSAFALGVNGRWEIVQYKTATLVAPLTYTLTGLLRGRRGTEWATGTHQAGDHFILLNGGGIQFYDPGAADANVARLYKAPAFRAALSSATAVSFTDTLVRLRPYSVANLKVEDTGSSHMITWAHRSILGGGWRDGVDVPLDATFVAFDVSIYKMDGTLVKTYSVTDEFFDYTDAQAAADFGAAPGDFKVRVAQRNSDYGQGVGVTVAANDAALVYDVPPIYTGGGGATPGDPAPEPEAPATDAWKFEARLDEEFFDTNLSYAAAYIHATSTHVFLFAGVTWTFKTTGTFFSANPNVYVFNRATKKFTAINNGQIGASFGFEQNCGAVGDKHYSVDGRPPVGTAAPGVRDVICNDFTDPAAPTRSMYKSANEMVGTFLARGQYNFGRMVNGKIWFPTSGSVFDPTANTWATMPLPPVDCRYRPILGSVGSKLYFLGGTTSVNDPVYEVNPGPVANAPRENTTYKKEVWVFDTVAGTWARKADLPYAIALSMVRMQTSNDPNYTASFNVEGVNGKLYVFDSNGQILVYDEAADAWVSKPNRISYRMAVNTCTLNGSIWMATHIGISKSYGPQKANQDLDSMSGGYLSEFDLAQRLLFRYTPSLDV